MMRARPGLNQNGFTLIETSVALLLLGMSALLALDLFTLAGHALREPAPSVETVRMLELVRGRIEGAYPAWVADGPALPHVDFVGADRLIEMIGPAPQALRPGGLERWRLALVAGPGGTDRLEISVRGAPAESVPLGEHGAGFAYFGQIGPAAAPGWHDSWQNQPTLPLLVRLRPGAMPELVAHPLLAPEAGCRATDKSCGRAP